MTERLLANGGKKYRRMYFRTPEEANRARNDMISQYITVL